MLGMVMSSTIKVVSSCSSSRIGRTEHMLLSDVHKQMNFSSMCEESLIFAFLSKHPLTVDSICRFWCYWIHKWWSIIKLHGLSEVLYLNHEVVSSIINLVVVPAVGEEQVSLCSWNLPWQRWWRKFWCTDMTYLSLVEPQGVHSYFQ